MDRQRVRVPSAIVLGRYGITSAQYLDQFQSQDFACAICRTYYKVTDKYQSWAIDHNHENGEARGILCFRCNAGIGQLREDPEIFARASRYCQRANGFATHQIREAPSAKTATLAKRERQEEAMVIRRSFLEKPARLRDMGWSPEAWHRALARMGGWEFADESDPLP